MDRRKTKLVEHRSSSGPVVEAVRGSLIVSSLSTLQELQLHDRYTRLVAPAVLQEVTFALASSWLPVSVVMSHYEACENLQLPEVQMKAIGEHVSTKLVSTFWGASLRQARVIGAAVPHDIALKQYGTMWDRLFQGGSSVIEELGPKDARIHARGLPMVRFRYFQIAYTGLIRGAALMFFRACHVKVERVDAAQLSILVSWV